MNHHLVTALGAIGLLAIGYVCGHAVASRRRRSTIEMEAVEGVKPAAGKKGSMEVERLAARYEDFKMVSPGKVAVSGISLSRLDDEYLALRLSFPSGSCKVEAFPQAGLSPL